MILRASCGINYEEFVEFLGLIARQRLRTIQEKETGTPRELKDMDSEARSTETGSEISVFQDWSRSIRFLEEQEQCSLMNYCRYDLIKVKECLVNLKDEHSFIEMQSRDLQLRIDALLQDISVTLENASGRSPQENGGIGVALWSQWPASKSSSVVLQDAHFFAPGKIGDERVFIICVRLPTDPWPACLTQGRRLSRGLKNAFVAALIMKASLHTVAHKDKI